MKVLFCNIAFMKYYKGVVSGVDEPSNLVTKSKKIEDIEEQYNFSPCDMEDKEVCLGYLPVKGTDSSKVLAQIHLEKIDESAADAEYIDDVLVIWCAKKIGTDNRTVVVGWYNHARVYKYYQEAIFGEGDEEFHQLYSIMADAKDCVLLPTGERSRYTRWNVPRKKGEKGPAFGFGTSNVWYANEEKAKEFVDNLIERINDYSEDNWIDHEVE